MHVMMARRVRTATRNASCRKLRLFAMMPLDGTRASTSCTPATRAFGPIGADLAVDALGAAGGSHQLVPGGRSRPARGRGAGCRVSALAPLSLGLRRHLSAHSDSHLRRLLHLCAH